MRQTLKTALLALCAAAIPATAFAHTGVGSTHGFTHGFMHPVGGLDHILAMVAVGMMAATIGGRALWLVPSSFVLMMAAGGLAGLEGLPLPFVETGIALSVLVLGLAIAFRWTPPVVAAMGLVGAFALFHGHAHGAEMPADASGLDYAAGFMTATALLHLAGIGIGSRIPRFALRTGGALMALAGMGLLAGAL